MSKPAPTSGPAAEPPPLPDLEHLEAARERIRGRIHRTPLMSATLLGERRGVRLWLKCENLQKTGSFKVRGVLNKLLRLPAGERERGVVTVSAGNHAQALAWGAGQAGIDCKVVMPEDAPRAKVEASRQYGAAVVLHGDVFAAFDEARRLEREEGRAFIHPFDDPDILAGQGTAGLEILEDFPAGPAPDAVVVPIGGGGLIGGIARAVKLRSPGTRVYGVEPTGAAVMKASLDAGRAVRLEKVETIADGLAAPMAGELPFRSVREHVERIVLVSDDEIALAMGALLRFAKLLAEPAGAASVAALLAGVLPVEEGERLVCVVSGGNVDLGRLKELL